MDCTPLITSTSHVYGVDPLLVAAVVQHESSNNPWAWNPEPKYRYFWDVKTNHPFRSVTAVELMLKYPPKDFPALAGDPDQEWWGQSASWGLGQVMGAVAREEGFTGPYLTELSDPATGLTYAVKHLAKAIKRAQGERSVALSIYNSGSPTSPQGGVYAAAVLAIMEGMK